MIKLLPSIKLLINDIVCLFLFTGCGRECESGRRIGPSSVRVRRHFGRRRQSCLFRFGIRPTTHASLRHDGAKGETHLSIISPPEKKKKENTFSLCHSCRFLFNCGVSRHYFRHCWYNPLHYLPVLSYPSVW